MTGSEHFMLTACFAFVLSFILLAVEFTIVDFITKFKNKRKKNKIK